MDVYWRIGMYAFLPQKTRDVSWEKRNKMECTACDNSNGSIYDMGRIQRRCCR